MSYHDKSNNKKQSVVSAKNKVASRAKSTTIAKSKGIPRAKGKISSKKGAAGCGGGSSNIVDITPEGSNKSKNH